MPEESKKKTTTEKAKEEQKLKYELKDLPTNHATYIMYGDKILSQPEVQVLILNKLDEIIENL